MRLAILALLLGGTLAAGASLFERGKRPVQGVIPPASRGSAGLHGLSARGCAKCHGKIYREWKASRHARSYSNRIFQVSFQHSPYRWCIHCHAPLPEQREALRGSLRDYPKKPTRRRSRGKAATRPASAGLLNEGVNCATCHIRKGRILMAKKPSKMGRMAHPKFRVEPLLKKSQFCAGCHQFKMVKKLSDPRVTKNLVLQNTYKEWLTSHARKQGKTCQSCHMSKGQHRFPGAHDAGWMRKALSVDVKWVGPGKLQARLSAKGVGHSTPTGDPFRRMRLEICRDVRCKKVLASQLLRKVQTRQRDGSYSVHSDTRIPTPRAQARASIAFVFRLVSQRQPVYWQLGYYFAEFHHHKYLTASQIRTVLFKGRLRGQYKSK